MCFMNSIFNQFYLIIYYNMSLYIDIEIIKPNTPVAQTVPMAPTPPPTEPTA